MPALYDWQTAGDFPVVVPASTRARLEDLREVLRSESISYGELIELQGLAEFIEPGDTELLEAAGVPEFPDEPQPCVYCGAGSNIRCCEFGRDR
jgi:hypothetical protein